MEAKELPLGACRVGKRSDTYYEDISDDESSKDIIAELEELRELQQDTINDFNVDLLMAEECQISDGEVSENASQSASKNDKENSASISDENSARILSNVQSGVNDDDSVCNDHINDVISEKIDESASEVINGVFGVNEDTRIIDGDNEVCEIASVKGAENDSEGGHSEFIPHYSDISSVDEDDAEIEENNVIIISDDDGDDADDSGERSLCSDYATKRLVTEWTYTIRRTYMYHGEEVVYEQLDTSVDNWNYKI